MMFSTLVDLGQLGEQEIDVEIDYDEIVDSLDGEDIINLVDWNDDDIYRAIPSEADSDMLADALVDTRNWVFTERLLIEMARLDPDEFFKVIKKIQNQQEG